MGLLRRRQRSFGGLRLCFGHRDRRRLCRQGRLRITKPLGQRLRFACQPRIGARRIIANTGLARRIARHRRQQGINRHPPLCRRGAFGIEQRA